jgi:hypothetical protein
MKRFAPVLVSAAALLWSANAARAQIPVTCTSCPTELSEIIRHGKTLAEWARQIQVAQNQYQEAVRMYNAVTGIRDIGTAASALNVLGIQNPLPVNPYAAQNILNGTGGTQGMLGNLRGLFTGASSANMVYQPSLRTWIGQQVNQYAQSIAGNQAMSLQVYQSASDRAPIIADLRRRIATAPDPATRERLTAELAAVQADIQNQAVQQQAITSYGIQTVALREQRREERIHQQIDAQIQEGRARGWVE